MEAQLDSSGAIGQAEPNPVLTACGDFLADFDLEMAICLGGRILPIVGSLNSGAEHALEELQRQATVLGVTALHVKIPPTRKPVDTVIRAIAHAVKCPCVMELDLFGSLSACLQEKGVRVITLEGASHLTEQGIRELAQLCQPSGIGQLGPLVIWHAKPGWELAYRPDAPPRSVFLGGVHMPLVDIKLSESAIRRAFPCLVTALNPTNELSWQRILDATAGELGSLWILDKESAKATSARPNQSAVQKTQLVIRLLDMLFGKPREIVTTQAPPKRTDPAENLGISKSLPGNSVLMDEPSPSRTRGSYGKRARRSPRQASNRTKPSDLEYPELGLP